MSRIELNEDVLEMINGGSIDYLPDSAKSESGKIGINGNYTHTYSNESDMLAYCSEHRYDKEWTSIAERDNYLFNGLIQAQIIKAISN